MEWLAKNADRLSRMMDIVSHKYNEETNIRSSLVVAFWLDLKRNWWRWLVKWEPPYGRGHAWDQNLGGLGWRVVWGGGEWDGNALWYFNVGWSDCVFDRKNFYLEIVNWNCEKQWTGTIEICGLLEVEIMDEDVEVSIMFKVGFSIG